MTAPRPTAEAGAVAGGRRVVAVAVATACMAVAAAARAEVTNLRFTPTLSAQVTYTNNVNLTEKSEQEPDGVLNLAPGFTVDYRAARASLVGTVSLPILLYARTGDENNRLQPLVNLAGRLEAVEKFFFIDAAVVVSQGYFSPFGSTSTDPANASQNQYNYASYQVSPYIEGVLAGNIAYRLRDDNIWWRNLDSNPLGIEAATPNSYTNHLVGTIERAPMPLGWGIDLDRNSYQVDNEFQTQIARDYLLEFVRVRGSWQPTPNWQLFASAGYENNDFPLTSSSGMTYGAALRWRPTERTRLDAAWEQRFFGGSYLFAFEHRTPLTVWNADASRNVTTTPQQAGTLSSRGFIAGLLNDLVAARIKDPDERARYVANYVRDRGLPTIVSGPVTTYDPQPYVLTNASAGVGLTGVRNSVFGRAFYLKSVPVTATGEALPPVLAGQNNNTQFGGSLSWSYRVSPLTSMTLTGDLSRTEDNTVVDQYSNLRGVRLYFNRPISQQTALFAGARWQRQTGERTTQYEEAAVFGGVSYTYR